MLVLTRKKSSPEAPQTIICEIGGVEIKIEVVDIKPHTVKIGIAAPDLVRIHRGEIWERIKAEEAT